MQVVEPGPPLQVRRPGHLLGRRLHRQRRVGEPPGAPGGRREPAGEPAPAEHHRQPAHLGTGRRVLRVAGGVEHGDVPGRRAAGVHQGPHRRPDAVRTDEEVCRLGGAVGEHRRHRAAGAVRVGQAGAVADVDAAAERLGVQGAVQVRAPHRQAGRPPGRRMAGRQGTQELAGPAAELDHGGREPRGADDVLGVDGAQSVEAVDLHAEPRADVPCGRRVGLVDGRLDAHPLQRHGGHRAGDPAADDDRSRHAGHLRIGAPVAGGGSWAGIPSHLAAGVHPISAWRPRAGAPRPARLPASPRATGTRERGGHP
ncbi:hypothetical protein FB380_000937 [Modestobacter marinus]|uniref:Uncharacterized protein n=1 Tax=Modestobacter marinus TaxID=477641 RepID=A0A846LGV8_9ACTN|nr:hypothetical protein [Modestobacter marinus]